MKTGTLKIRRTRNRLFEKSGGAEKSHSSGGIRFISRGFPIADYCQKRRRLAGV